MFLNQPKSSFMTAEHSRQRLLTQYPVHKVFKLTTFSWYKLWNDLPFSNITLVKTDYWWKLLNFLSLSSDYWHNFGFTKLSYWPWASSGRCKPGKYILFSHLTLINLITLSIDYWLICKVVKLVQLFYQESWNERTKRKMERRCKLWDRSSFSCLWELFRHSFAGSKVALKFITRMQLWEWVWHFSQKPLHKCKKIKQQ